MAAPTNYPEWASTSATLPETGGANKVQPSASLQTVGFDKNSVPTAEEENWLRANLYEWVVHLDESSQQATETVKGIAELATQAETDAGTNDTNIVTPLKLKSRLDSRVASETVSGLVELATDAETAALTDDTRAVTPLKLETQLTARVDSLLLGVGQTWQDVSGSRVTDTSYQNTTGKPIMVNVTNTSGNSAYTQFSVSTDDITFVVVSDQGAGSTSRHTHSVVVPNNHYYKVSTGLGVLGWVELR